jgi:hypothetical protein
MVIANAAARYLSSLTRVLNSAELDVFYTTVFDMPFENAADLLNLNNNVRLFFTMIFKF